jgi:hypothetical protein
VEPVDHVGLRVADVEPDTDELGKTLERGNDAVSFDLGPPVRRDRQSAVGEIDLVFGLGDQALESRSRRGQL